MAKMVELISNRTCLLLLLHLQIYLDNIMGSRRSGPPSTSASGKASGSTSARKSASNKASSTQNSNNSENSGFSTEQMALYKVMRTQLAAKKKEAIAAKDEGMLILI
jgi:hypothetical protein